MTMPGEAGFATGLPNPLIFKNSKERRGTILGQFGARKAKKDEIGPRAENGISS